MSKIYYFSTSFQKLPSAGALLPMCP